jgi:hypothetical protein
MKIKKMPFFFFFFYKKWRTEGQNRSCRGPGTSESGKDIRKGYKRVNMEQILYICVCTWKKIRPI